MHYLARCSDVCKALKKNQKFVRPTRSTCGSNDLIVGRKMATFQLFFQSREQVVVRRGQIRRIGWCSRYWKPRWVISFRVASTRGAGALSCKKKSPLVTFPRPACFLQNVLQLHQQRWVEFGALEENQWGGCRLDPKKSRREIFQRIFALGIFWGGVSRYAATPLIVALSPGQSDITRFRPWSPIATGKYLDRGENIPKVARTNGTFDIFDPRSGISEPTSRRASASPNLHEWWTQPIHVRCPAAQLLI